MIKLKPYSASILAFGGFLLWAMGVYFIFIRPPLLPEDLRYMKIILPMEQDKMQGLQIWLKKVFWVMGCYIFTTGLLTIFIAFTSFRTRTRGVYGIVAFSGISSIGAMTVVNFMIDSDFKWILLIFTLPWVIALILYRLHK
jgi:hypothetical protein